MKLLCLLLVTAAGLLASGPVASAPGTVRISWDLCDPVVSTKCLEAGDRRLSLVVSVRGTDEPHRGHRIKLRIFAYDPRPDCFPGPCPPGPHLVEAWRFDASGCNVGQLTVETSSLGIECPAFQGSNPLPLHQYSYEAGSATLDMLNAYDEVSEPNPQTQYVLYKVTFDHSRSVCGEAGGAGCGHLDHPIFFFLNYAEFLRSDLTSDAFGIEYDAVAWQDMPCVGECDFTQAESSTWGRLKGLYR